MQKTKANLSISRYKKGGITNIVCIVCSNIAAYLNKQISSHSIMHLYTYYTHLGIHASVLLTVGEVKTNKKHQKNR